MSSKNNSGSGVGFFGVLAALFIGLKLTNYITWSWWWVLAPLWLPITVALAIMGLTAIILVLAAKK